jgi:poly-gamma-glutamate capsule biosynthesis protein CapA/YwtB (metallophosphatase superfamily)
MVTRQPAAPLRLLFAGDLMLGRRVGERIKAGGDPLANIRELVSVADYAVGNLECVIAEPHTHDPLKGQVLCAPPEAAGLLKKAGFDALSVANNHAMDLGAAGAEESRRRLQEAGIRPVDSTPMRVTVGQTELGFVAWDDTREADATPLLDSIRKLRNEVDALIVLPHWGREHERQPTERQRELAAAMLRAGADVIVGSGPHVVQRLERHAAGGLAYSLGNTVFDGPGPDLDWSHGMLLEVTMDADSRRIVRLRSIAITFDLDGTVRVE